MLALATAFEATVECHALDFGNLWASAWSRSGAAAKREAARCGVIALGDSLVKQGIVPRVLEERFGRPAYNLAVFNGQAPTTYYLLRRALAAGARPVALIVDGELLEEDPRSHERRWMELLEFPEIADFARTSGDPRLLASLALGRLLPTVRARFEVRDALLAALRGEAAGVRHVAPVHWRNWRANRGAHLVPCSTTAASLEGPIAESGYLPSEWACHPLNALYVERFLSLAAARKVPVFWVLPPLHPEIHRRRESGGMHARYLAYLRGLQERFPSLVVVDGRESGYGPAVLADLTHLNVAGALAFSAAIAEVLTDRLSGSAADGPRWVALPHYRPGPVGPLVEDLAESEIALRRSRPAMRR